MRLKGFVTRLRRVVLPSYADELLYVARRGDTLTRVRASVPVAITKEPGIRTRYVGVIDGRPVHVSTLFSRVFLPRLFGFRNDLPCIGACETDEAFRGKRIYPYVLQQIVEDVFERTQFEGVYILVAPSNTASIRGIELAGFKFAARLRGWRFGPFVLKDGPRGSRFGSFIVKRERPR